MQTHLTATHKTTALRTLGNVHHLALRYRTTALPHYRTTNDACTPSHEKNLFDAVANDNKAFVKIIGATQYCVGQHGQLHEADQASILRLRKKGVTNV